MCVLNLFHFFCSMFSRCLLYHCCVLFFFFLSFFAACLSWCSKSLKVWDEKCTWPGSCDGCSECAGMQISHRLKIFIRTIATKCKQCAYQKLLRKYAANHRLVAQTLCIASTTRKTTKWIQRAGIDHNNRLICYHYRVLSELDSNTTSI